VGTQPRNSIHGPPRNDATDGPTADSGGPSGPAPQFVPDPYLQVIWGDAPAVTGDVGPTGPGGGGANVTHRNHGPITVDLGSIESAENGMLAQSRQAVSEYMYVKQQVENAINGGVIWGQQATKTVTRQTNTTFYGATGGGSGPAQPTTVEPDQAIQQAAQQYAAVMNPVMTEVLRQIADSVESVGQFIVGLNRSAQLYAYADKNSFFPDPPPSPVTQ
jgi:hypothetical protein